jgi:hypothetical protein
MVTVVHKAFNTCEIATVFHFQVHDVVDVEPQVVIFADVAHETALCVFIKCKSFVVANETHVGFVLLHELFALTQLSECVDDNTSQNVCHCNLYNDEERNVDSPLNPIFLQILIVVKL